MWEKVKQKVLDGICSFVEVAKGKPLFHKKRIVSSKALRQKFSWHVHGTVRRPI